MQKKNLLITTALATLLSAFAFADGAAPSILDDMSVKVGGLYDAKLISRIPAKINGYVTANNSPGVDSNAQIYIEAKNSTAKGLEYGAHIGMRTNTLSSRQPQMGIDRSWLWMEHSDMGRVEIGSNNDTSESMRIGADRVATATGGINGDWFKILTQESFGNNSQISHDEFHLKPWGMGDNKLDVSDINDAAGHLNDRLEKSRKINYYSPKMNGFQVGVSYIFDTANLGYKANMPNTTFPGQIGRDKAFISDLFSGGINWEGNISNDVKASTSFVVTYGNMKRGELATQQSRQLAAFDVGGMISYKKLKAAASYGYTGKTGFQENATGLGVKNGWYATAGLGYEFDKLVTSFTYFHGYKNTNTSDIFSLGADYHLASGVMPYAEITHYKVDLKRIGALALSDGGGSDDDITVIAANAPNNKFDGTAIMLGAKLSF